MLHHVYQLQVDLAHRDREIDLAPVAAEAVFDVADLGGAGRDEANADILPRKLGVLFLCLLDRHRSCDLHRRQQWDEVILEEGEAQNDKPRYDGARRADDGLLDAVRLEINSRVCRDGLRSPRDLKHIVEADIQQPLQDYVDIVEIVKLSEQRRCGQRNFILEAVHLLKRIEAALFCAVGTFPDAFAAVDAALGVDLGAAADSDGLGGAMLHAGRAAGAFIRVERYGMDICIH